MRVLLALFFLALAGCGFHPLYGGASGQIRRAELAQVQVTEIKSRLGSEMRNALIDRLTPDGEPVHPQYRLDVSLTEFREGVAIQQDASITRYNYQLTGNYKLVDLGTGKIVYEGQARSMNAYNVVDSPYATLTAERDAASRTALDVAAQMELGLAAYFDRRGH
jgi:LPS-assembly lipoprotein